MNSYAEVLAEDSTPTGYYMPNYFGTLKGAEWAPTTFPKDDLPSLNHLPGAIA